MVGEGDFADGVLWGIFLAEYQEDGMDGDRLGVLEEVVEWIHSHPERSADLRSRIAELWANSSPTADAVMTVEDDGHDRDEGSEDDIYRSVRPEQVKVKPKQGNTWKDDMRLLDDMMPADDDDDAPPPKE